MTRRIGLFAMALLALALIGAGVWALEAQRAGLVIEDTVVGNTPVTYYASQDAGPAPLVVVAHGFAGSRPLMAAYAQALARAGYVVAAFDFEGHGRNPVPMSGDVTSIEGTTQLLIDETLRVVAAGLARADVDGRVALLGHSMASDIIVRAAARDARIGAVVAISPFSQAVTATHPERLLMIAGAWEPRLRAFALEAARMVDANALEGETVRSANGAVVRRAVVAPHVEHVGVLYSRTAVSEAVAWLNAAFARTQAPPVPARGIWILAVLAGCVLLVRPLAALLPDRAPPHAPLPGKRFAAALLLPALATPLIAVWVPDGWLPVLVADYLAVHLLIYGALQLAVLRAGGGDLGLRPTPLALAAGAGLAVYGIFGLGLAFDRYLASFMPHAGRLAIIAALLVGALPFMLADSAMAHANPKLWKRALIRLAFLVSLGIAVALSFERLFFLVLIIPIVLLFFLVFGLMGRWVEARAGPLASGLGLAVLLAWSLGVTFPLFV
ncbi:alpha/beta fold hydrolase [Stappia sp.]|uniref:alpha/beta fold hydrolase n=1 Tax=Stappia sp. TaxID=1870903 RepID=UPI0032D92694